MKKKALVVVLGDLARSPRMQYHCISLANNNYDVTVIANGDNTRGYENLESNRNIKKKLMPDTLNFRKFLPTFLAYLLRPLWQSLLLMIKLLTTPIPNVIILQNPPSIPTLPIIYMYTRLVRSRLIIDWHNYGFSILKLSLGPDHLLVRIYYHIEVFFGRLADSGFCVSEAMKTDLRESLKITYPLFVLYDKPPSHFKPLTIREKHDFYLKVGKAIPAFKSTSKDQSNRRNTPKGDCETRFTITSREPPYHVIPKPERPAIVLSSTSWTEDEDFNLLLDALRLYDESFPNKDRHEQSDHIENADYQYSGYSTDQNELLARPPELICVITGKGPLKPYYEEKIAKMNLNHIEIVLPWLSAEDYINMVGSSDVGISLHSSSSGVDLPMKVVDLFGCGVPVLAYEYKAINELVRDQFYGMTFSDSMQLSKLLNLFLRNFHPQDSSSGESCPSPLGSYRKNIIRHFLNSRWEDNWITVAKPVFDKLSQLSE